MNRRGFLLGMLAAPVVIRTPGLLMPVKPVEPLVAPLGMKFHTFEIFGLRQGDQIWLHTENGDLIAPEDMAVPPDGRLQVNVPLDETNEAKLHIKSRSGRCTYMQGGYVGVGPDKTALNVPDFVDHSYEV